MPKIIDKRLNLYEVTRSGTLHVNRIAAENIQQCLLCAKKICNMEEEDIGRVVLITKDLMVRFEQGEE
jgi:hypothetical protein